MFIYCLYFYSGMIASGFITNKLSHKDTQINFEICLFCLSMASIILGPFMWIIYLVI